MWFLLQKKWKEKRKKDYDNILRNKKEAIIVKFRFSEKAIKIWNKLPHGLDMEITLIEKTR